MAASSERNHRPLASVTVLEDYLDAAKLGSALNQQSFNELAGTPQQRDILLQACKSHLRLSDYLDELISISPALPDQVKTLLNCLREESCATRQYIKSGLASEPLSTAPTTTSGSKAQEVCDLAELADMIFGLLPYKDIFSFMQVNRALHLHITGSQKVQRPLGFTPHLSSFWKTNFGEESKHTNSDFICYVNPKRYYSTFETTGDELCNDVWVIVVLFPSDLTPHQEQRLPKLGPRALTRLVCQPPVKEMHAEPLCCSNVNRDILVRRFPIPKRMVVSSSSGLTVGDLRNVAEELVPKHHLCPYAEVYQHNGESGRVQVPVWFEGTMTLAHNDPALLVNRNNSRRVRLSKFFPSPKHTSTQKDQISRYLWAKQEGMVFRLCEHNVDRS